MNVKIFINAKNSRRAKKKQQPTANNEENSEGDAANITDEKILDENEVYFTARENVEGFTATLQYYWGSLSSLSNTCIINVNTTTCD